MYILYFQRSIQKPYVSFTIEESCNAVSFVECIINETHVELWYVSVMYDSYLLKDVHSVLVNFPREYALESMMLYI